MKRQLLVLLVLVLALGAVLASCGGAEEEQPTKTATPAPSVQPVKIGVNLDLSGVNSVAGRDTLKGIQLAAEEINAMGGIKSLGGAPIELIVRDNRFTSDVIQRQFQDLVSQDVSIVIGLAGTPECTAAAGLATQLKVPAMGTSFSSAFMDSVVTNKYDYFFNEYPTDRIGCVEMLKAVKWVGEKMGKPITKVALLNVDNSYGQSQRNAYRSYVGDFGMTIVYEAEFPTNTADLTPQLTAVKQSGAQAILDATMGPECVTILRNMASLGMDLPIIGPGAVTNNTTVLGLSPDMTEGTLNCAPQVNDLSKPGVQKLNQMHIAKFGTYMTGNGGDGYLMVWIVKEALEKAASSDPIALKQAIETIRITSGPAVDNQPMSEVYFKDMQRMGILMPTGQIQKGILVTVYPENIAAGPLNTAAYNY